MICYISRNYRGLSSAGNKAKTDIEQIMDNLSFKNIGLKQTTYNNKIVSFFMTLTGVLKSPFFMHKGDRLILQYPFKKYFTFICRMAHQKGVKVIVLIHDLGSFRRKALTIKQEINRLNHADYIIAHNDRMKAWLEEHHCKAQIGKLGIFDYLSESTAKPKDVIRKPYSVVYAGALNPRKNAFLYEVGEHCQSLQLNLYGNGFDMQKAKGITQINYMGFLKSDDLITTVQGDFGLVWDGPSIETCSGNFGEYLKYNNPHKTSLYIRCGLPIIIWEKAALADFVQKNQIGICISSLRDIEPRLKRMTEEEYWEMYRNVQNINTKISSGFYFREALASIVYNQLNLKRT